MRVNVAMPEPDVFPNALLEPQIVHIIPLIKYWVNYIAKST